MGKIRHLEGLRGLASMIVFISHIVLFLFPQEYAQFPVWLSHDLQMPHFFLTIIMSVFEFFLDGNLAVWIFWFLSAYVISIKFFIKKEASVFFLLPAILKRYVRLMIPVLVSVLLSWLLMALGLIYSQQLVGKIPSNNTEWIGQFYLFHADFLKALISALYFTFFNFKGIDTYNYNLWTIQNEFLGSIFIFSLFSMVGKRSGRWSIYFMILLLLAYFHFSYLSLFLIGYALCDYDFFNGSNRLVQSLKKTENFVFRNRLLSFFAASIGIFLLRDFILKCNLHFNYQMLLSIIVVYFVLRINYFIVLFSTQFFVWLGKISFSLYLLHLPLLCSFTSFFCVNFFSFKWRIVIALLSVMFAFLLAYIFEKYVDRFAVRVSKMIRLDFRPSDSEGV